MRNIFLRKKKAFTADWGFLKLDVCMCVRESVCDFFLSQVRARRNVFAIIGLFKVFPIKSRLNALYYYYSSPVLNGLPVISDSLQ